MEGHVLRGLILRGKHREKGVVDDAFVHTFQMQLCIDTITCNCPVGQRLLVRILGIDQSVCEVTRKDA